MPAGTHPNSRANLKSFTSDQDKEAASRNGKKGALAKAMNKRERKKMAEYLDIIMKLPLNDEKAKKAISDMGVEDEDMTNGMALMLKTFQNAMKGDLKSTEFIRDTVGEKPIDRQEIAGNVTGGTISLQMDYGTDEDYKAGENESTVQ